MSLWELLLLEGFLKNIDPATNYYVRAKVYYNNGINDLINSPYSKVDSGYCRLDTLTGLTATKAVYKDKIILKWDTLISNNVGWKKYKIHRNDLSDEGVFVTTLDSYVDDKVETGVFYKYKVKVLTEKFSESYYSEEDSGCLSLPVPVLTSVSQVSGMDSLQLVWTFDTKATSMVDSFIVYRLNSSDAPFSPSVIPLNKSELRVITSGNNSVLSWKQGGLERGKYYFYYLQASSTSISDKSAMTDTLSGCLVLGASDTIVATRGDFKDSIRVVWNRALDGKKYLLYRSATIDGFSVGMDSLGEFGALDTVYIDTVKLNTVPKRGVPYFYRVRTKNVDDANFVHYSDFSNANFGFSSLDTVQGFSVEKSQDAEILRANWSSLAVEGYSPLYTLRWLSAYSGGAIKDSLVTTDTSVDLRSNSAFGSRLKQGTVYYFNVSAKVVFEALDDTTYSPVSLVDSGYTSVPAPVLTASYWTIVDTIKVSWNSISSFMVDSIKLQWSGDRNTWDSVTVNYETYTDSVYKLAVDSRLMGVPVYIKARFEGSSGNTDYSTIVTGAARIRGPKNLTVTKGVSADSITLQWKNYLGNNTLADDNTGDYTIYMSDSVGGPFNQSQIIKTMGITDASVYSYGFDLNSISSSVPGVFYYFKVGGSTSIGAADSLSNVDSGFVLPPKIYISSCSKKRNGEILVTFSLSSTVLADTAAYKDYGMQIELQRKIDATGSFEPLDSLQGFDTLTYTDLSNELEPGVNFYYRARLHSRRLAEAMGGNKDLSSSAWCDSILGKCAISLSDIRLVSDSVFYTDSIPLEVLLPKKVDSIFIGRVQEGLSDTTINKVTVSTLTSSVGSYFKWTDNGLEDGKLYYYFVKTKKKY